MNVGLSGEYYLAGELSRRGFIASLTLKNTKGVDIIVTNQDASKAISIQVKTNYNKSCSAWILSKNSEAFNRPNMFFAFVRLPKDLFTRPVYFFVPGNIVASYIQEQHQKWLNTPGKSGQKHNDTNMRKYIMADDTYRENWHLIENHLSVD